MAAATGLTMRRGALVTALAFGLELLAAGSEAAAQVRPPADVTNAAGGYLLAAEKGARRCMVLLRTMPVEGGYAVGFPAHCRLALPILVKTAAWTVEKTVGPPHGRIRFRDAAGKTVLDFDRDGPNDTVAATDEAGLEHTLAPGDGRSLALRFGQPPAPRARQVAVAVGPATAPTTVNDTGLMSATAGNYILLRGKERPTGCSLTLSPALTGDARAALQPGCPDRGLQIFAADRWSISGGTLWLLNARGQKLSFERNRQNGWDKSAGQGEPLSLRRQP